MNTKSILNFYKSIEITVTGFTRMITNIFTFSITEIAPLVAPLPPAFSIFTAMTERLHVPVYVAVIAAAAIEIIGLFSSKVSIRCYQWNSSKSKSEPSVPQGLSVLMTSIFFVVVLLLALTVELIPGLTALVIPGFILISVSTYFNLAVHVNLEKLEAAKVTDIELRKEKSGIASDIRKAKTELQNLNDTVQKLTTERIKLVSDIETATSKMNRLNAKNDTSPSPNDTKLENDLSKANDTRRLKKQDRLNRIIELSKDHSQNEIATMLNVSVSTIKRDYKSLNGSLSEVK